MVGQILDKRKGLTVISRSAALNWFSIYTSEGGRVHKNSEAA